MRNIKPGKRNLHHQAWTILKEEDSAQYETSHLQIVSCHPGRTTGETTGTFRKYALIGSKIAVAETNRNMSSFCLFVCLFLPEVVTARHMSGFRWSSVVVEAIFNTLDLPLRWKMHHHLYRHPWCLQPLKRLQDHVQSICGVRGNSGKPV